MDNQIDFAKLKAELKRGHEEKKTQEQQTVIAPQAMVEGAAPKLKGRDFLMHMYQKVNGGVPGQNPAANLAVQVMEATEAKYDNKPQQRLQPQQRSQPQQMIMEEPKKAAGFGDLNLDDIMGSVNKKNMGASVGMTNDRDDSDAVLEQRFNQYTQSLQNQIPSQMPQIPPQQMLQEQTYGGIKMNTGGLMGNPQNLNEQIDARVNEMIVPLVTKILEQINIQGQVKNMINESKSEIEQLVFDTIIQIRNQNKKKK